MALPHNQQRVGQVVHDAEAIWPQLFELISEGRALTNALKLIPSQPTYAWAKHQLRDPELKSQYKQAQEDRADKLVDDLLELVDAPIPEHLDGGERVAYVNHLRLKLDTRKWIACKFRPGMYGDRTTVDVNATHRISISTALAEANERVLNDPRTIEGAVINTLTEEP